MGWQQSILAQHQLYAAPQECHVLPVDLFGLLSHASPAVHALHEEDSDSPPSQQHGRRVQQLLQAADEAATGAGSSGSGVANATSGLAQACNGLCSCACAAHGTAGAAAALEDGGGAKGSRSGVAAPLLGSISEGLQPQVSSKMHQSDNAAVEGDMPLPVLSVSGHATLHCRCSVLCS